MCISCIYHSFDELPAIFDVATLQKFLDISRSAAYQLVNQSDFPTIRVGKIILIDKAQFKIWLDNQSNKKAS